MVYARSFSCSSLLTALVISVAAAQDPLMAPVSESSEAEAAVQELRNLPDPGDDWDRLSVCPAVAKCVAADWRAAPALESLAKSPAPRWVRVAALYALGQIGLSAASPHSWADAGDPVLGAAIASMLDNATRAGSMSHDLPATLAETDSTSARLVELFGKPITLSPSEERNRVATLIARLQTSSSIGIRGPSVELPDSRIIALLSLHWDETARQIRPALLQDSGAFCRRTLYATLALSSPGALADRGDLQLVLTDCPHMESTSPIDSLLMLYGLAKVGTPAAIAKMRSLQCSPSSPSLAGILERLLRDPQTLDLTHLMQDVRSVSSPGEDSRGGRGANLTHFPWSRSPDPGNPMGPRVGGAVAAMTPDPPPQWPETITAREIHRSNGPDCRTPEPSSSQRSSLEETSLASWFTIGLALLTVVAAIALWRRGRH